jgi:guanylate kinase
VVDARTDEADEGGDQGQVGERRSRVPKSLQSGASHPVRDPDPEQDAQRVDVHLERPELQQAYRGCGNHGFDGSGELSFVTGCDDGRAEFSVSGTVESMTTEETHVGAAFPARGLFVSFEGIDGSGKSTLSKAVLEECLRRAIPSRRTFEPGDTELGAGLRPLLLSDTIGSRTSALLFAADRAHHVDTVVSPALGADQMVLCDRFETSSVVYQGVWRQLGDETIRGISRFASADLVPDIIVWSKIDPVVAAGRRGTHPDALDEAATRDADQIAEAFANEAAKDPDRFFVVDAHHPVAELVTQVADHLEQRWAVRVELAQRRFTSKPAPATAAPATAMSSPAAASAATTDKAGTSRGRLILISGPSGAGKNTVLDGLIAGNGDRRWYSVSVTTRAQRPAEQDGRDYHFIDDAAFEELLHSGGLLEHASFASARYGTPTAPIDERLAAGIDVFALVELSGVRQIKDKRPDAMVIFLIPPSMSALEQRLRSRATESESQIQARLSAARVEMEQGPQLADYVICNNDVATAVARIEHILRR